MGSKNYEEQIRIMHEENERLRDEINLLLTNEQCMKANIRKLEIDYRKKIEDFKQNQYNEYDKLVKNLLLSRNDACAEIEMLKQKCEELQIEYHSSQVNCFLCLY
ncbi:hypothetical protein HELRODRAFT_162468 [Helobdella robusta]|uniref:Uncharacterized protein n=1 Tax=Helobdella robusta TaxID=6412 RepID=T1ESP9_HELRO|nr:hypothetical protein HELRODRAFT_162468 [Helobdella robusta]ESN98993.1 hypothetical protein HELRODRAFT_162468 [Helobdella robusta]